MIYVKKGIQICFTLSLLLTILALTACSNSTTEDSSPATTVSTVTTSQQNASTTSLLLPDETTTSSSIPPGVILDEFGEIIFMPIVDKDVPLLMYHTSSEENPGKLDELYVKPSEFDKQIAWLIENGYTLCTFDDWYNLSIIDKPIFITFDDGYPENYTEIFPILKKYQAKITLFLVANTIVLSKEEIREMSDSEFVKFESHTLTHPSLVGISSNTDSLERELRESKDVIEALTGKNVLALAYPNGEFNDKVKQISEKYYDFALRKDLGMHNTKYDNYEIRRIRINRSTSLESFIHLITK